MVKNIPGNERANYLCKRLEGNHTYLETDYSQYDKTQRKVHLDVEMMLVKKIVPDMLDEWICCT